MRLVGYEGNHIYRLWDPAKRTIQRSSDVDFDEEPTLKRPAEVDFNPVKRPRYTPISVGELRDSEDRDTEPISHEPRSTRAYSPEVVITRVTEPIPTVTRAQPEPMTALLASNVPPLEDDIEHIRV